MTLLGKIADALPWTRELRGRILPIHRKIDHRRFVGGNWDVTGSRQLAFLQEQGLEPRHFLLDVACGSFRLGCHAIPFLDRGRYMGIEKHRHLIDAGIAHELGDALIAEKQPQLIVTGDFDFRGFDQPPDFVIAHSLFTHLVPDDIDRCFSNLRSIVHAETRFFATWCIHDGVRLNPAQSHELLLFAYSVDEMMAFGSAHGFRPRYVGEWGHAKGQVMVEYTPV